MARARALAAELLFEARGASTIGFAKAETLACFAVGRTSGLVVDLAAESTRVAAVVEGWVEAKVTS
jgi:actin-related protein